VRRDGALAKFELKCPDGPVELFEQVGFRMAEVAEVGAAVAAALPQFCAKWEQIHG
jgi:hypothetical protein